METLINQSYTSWRKLSPNLAARCNFHVLDSTLIHIGKKVDISIGFNGDKDFDRATFLLIAATSPLGIWITRLLNSDFETINNAGPSWIILQNMIGTTAALDTLLATYWRPSRVALLSLLSSSCNSYRQLILRRRILPQESLQLNQQVTSPESKRTD